MMKERGIRQNAISPGILKFVLAMAFVRNVIQKLLKTPDSAKNNKTNQLQ